MTAIESKEEISDTDSGIILHCGKNVAVKYITHNIAIIHVSNYVKTGGELCTHIKGTLEQIKCFYYPKSNFAYAVTKKENTKRHFM